MFNKVHGLLRVSLFFVLTLALTACGDKQNGMPKEIKIEGELITSTATPDKAAVVNDFLQARKKSVAILSKAFTNNFPGLFSLDTTQNHNISGLLVPTLTHNGQSLNFEHNIPDKFTAQHGAVATIFAKSGKDFVRVATSLKKEDGSRAFGTTLHYKHPAYASALEGKSYNGTATLFGMIYVTEYVPIKDSTGDVVGMLFVGMDITADLIPLKTQLR